MDKEEEVKLLLQHAAGTDAEKLVEALRRVASADQVLEYLRDMRLPTTAEIRDKLAEAIARGLGPRTAQMTELADMMQSYRTNGDARLTLDAHVDGIVTSLRDCFREGDCLAGVVQAGKNVVFRNGTPSEVPWTGEIFCDFCTGKLAPGQPIWYCGVSLKWQTVDGKVEDQGGYAVCGECKQLIEGTERLAFPDLVLLIARRHATTGTGVRNQE